MTIEFDDTLITGNELIDSQHQELISRIKQFVDSCEDGGGKIKAIQMLDYLADYTNFHFSAEEKLQQEVGYPGLAEHQKKHVIDWLFSHIKAFDRSVAEYIFLTENPDCL